MDLILIKDQSLIEKLTQPKLSWDYKVGIVESLKNGIKAENCQDYKTDLR